jgi:hypothetical protein
MSPTNTGFLNTKRRVIYRSDANKYFVRTVTGTASYNPKAKFHKSPGGTERATKYVKNLVAIPSPIRPKFNRKERKNLGGKRAAYAPRQGGMRVLPVKRNPFLAQLFSPKPVRGRGRPKKVRSPKPGPVMRRLLATKARKAKKASKPKKMLYKVKLGGQYVV